MVVEVGEVLSSKDILMRMNTRDDLPTSKGTVPFAYIPRQSTSLGQRLRMSGKFEAIPKTKNTKSHFNWRRIE